MRTIVFRPTFTESAARYSMGNTPRNRTHARREGCAAGFPRPRTCRTAAYWWFCAGNCGNRGEDRGTAGRTDGRRVVVEVEELVADVGADVDRDDEGDEAGCSCREG